MQFLYPSRRFPFGDVCEQMVQELEQRNWQVPGIEVEFDTYKNDEISFRFVRRIRSQDFMLWFYSVQYILPGNRRDYNAAMAEILIPQKHLRIYEYEPGPTFYLYVGDDWEKDREKFINGPKVRSKLNGEPRLYLVYKEGVAEAFTAIRRTDRGSRAPLLVHTNDTGREYDPKGDEPSFFNTADVMEEFQQYLTAAVLQQITSHPIPKEKVNVF